MRCRALPLERLFYPPGDYDRTNALPVHLQFMIAQDACPAIQRNEEGAGQP